MLLYAVECDAGNYHISEPWCSCIKHFSKYAYPYYTVSIVNRRPNGIIITSEGMAPTTTNDYVGLHVYTNTLSTSIPQQKFYCHWDGNKYVSAALWPHGLPYTPPNINSLSIPASNLKVGNTATATITVSSDSDDYTTGSGGISGTIGGFTVSNLSRINDTTYTATFTITDGGTDVPSGSDIPVSIKLTDSAGNQMANAFTTAISQDGDAIDANKPTLAEVIAVTTDTTPNYTFSTNEAGSIIYGGDCSSSTTSAVSGNNNISFNALAGGTHSNCTITVTDSAGNASNSLAVTAFTIAYSISITKTTDGAENNGSTPTDAVFTVSVTPANASGSAITGNLTYSGTATNGTDYATGATTFSIPDGSSTATIILDVTKDAIVEGTETITATLSSPSQGLLATTNTTANISDNFQNHRLNMNEDATYSFAETDFGRKKIKITQLPNVGDLYLDANSDGVIDSGETVTLNQEIEVIDISKLKFKPVANTNGNNYASFQFHIYEGSSYNVTAYTITIDVTAVNDAPVNNIPSTQTTDEDTPLIFSTDNSNLISISDIEAEDALGNSITVTLTATNGALTLSSTTDLTFTDGDGIDDANMEFNGSVTDINTALEGIIFNPNPQFYGDATVQIETNDQSLTDTDTINITVNPVNDIPSFTKGADQTVNEDSGAQTIANWATNISAGPSNEDSQTLNFTVTNNNNSLFKVQPTIDSTGNLSFTPAANATGIAVVSVVLSDGIDTSAAQTFNIRILDVNDEPINTIPTIQSLNEDSTLTFSTENSNNISITDSDAGTNPIKVKLTTTNGTLTLSGNTGLTFTIGTGTNDAEMVFTGTVTDINIALEGMIFNPTEEFYGDATIQIEVNDQSLTDTDTINITVNPVNDIPSFTKGDDQTVFVTGRQTIPNWATNISAGPSNESSQTLIFTVTNDNNNLFSVQPAIDPNGNLSFTPTAAGNAVITVVLSDGIDTSAAQIFNIKLNPLPASAPIQQTTSEPTASSVGTNINCTIKNEGTITDAKIEPECSIEGGTLKGEIKNEGTIKNVTLAAGTKIKGGQIQGKISGNPEAPAILQHLIIEPQTHTHNVIISDGVELSTDVSLASGVRFTTTENIPDGIDLTPTLPSITSNIAEVEQPLPLDLSHDPIVNGIGLLPKINQLSMIATNIQQNSDTGFLTLKIETTFFAVIPMKVRYVKTKTRASTEQAIRLGIGQRIYFTTEDGMEIMANPAVQDLKLLKTALAQLNLPTFKITEEANIKVPATETTWYSARPDLASTKVDKETANGFIIKEDNNIALIFEDEKGEKREQILYPSPADMSALGKFDLTPKGILEFEIDGQKFKGRLDYKVEQGKATSEAVKVTEIADSNDVMITYPDGTEQRLFALPE